MSKKVIGVVFSDLHKANWKQYNPDEKRLQITDRALKAVIDTAHKYKVPALFSGDLIDHPKYVENVVMKYVGKSCTYMRDKNINIIGINGNHDLDGINTYEQRTEGYLHHLQNIGAPFFCVDFKSYDTLQYKVHGIPYLNSNIGFIDALKERVEKRSKKRGNILLIHRDLAGAQEPDGKIVKKDKDGDEEIRKLFKKFDLVVSGHIHKPQYIKNLGKNILMAGATNQQRRSDRGCKMGYWLIYSDYSTSFVDLKLPEFKTFVRGEEHEDTEDFWIELPREDEKDKNTSGMVFKAAASKETLIKKYFKIKGIKSKRKFKRLMDLIND